MTHASLTLGPIDYRAPARGMVNLPGIQELGLLSSGRHGGPASLSEAGRSRTSSPSTNDTYCSQRSYKSEPPARTSPPLARSSYTYHDSPAISTEFPPRSSAGSHTAAVTSLEPLVPGHQAHAFEAHTSDRDRRSEWRRDSSESVSSTPSLVGSFASSCSSRGGTSPTLAPSTPRDSASLWNLVGKEYLLAQGPESDSTWLKPSFQNPFSAKVPRRNALKTPSPRPVSHHSSCKVHKKERARPKSTGQAHCNEKYTTEEDRFLIYFRVDHTMTWQQVETMYNERFTRGSRPYRTDGGLQSQFYRLNKVCPVVTDDKLLVFGPATKAEAKQNQYNEYDNLTWDCKQRQGRPASLVERYAEQIVEEKWEWIAEEDMAEAKRLADLRRPHRLAWEEWKKINMPVKSAPAQKEEAKD